MSDPPKKLGPFSSEANDAAARLERITGLWQRLQLTRAHTPKYNALIDQIRAETDAFRKILDAKKGLGPKESKD
ncbi:MAG: hypothetical protein A3H97_14370 [Acidobacteria bacterium RIFCSPLOWO2_02_FULL_65_29]|nr:MAG: hypothetical protein A3H97_14370 [Acidobacteria bacterium RIFCSPLOWO2_02_FULL_65_29]